MQIKELSIEQLKAIKCDHYEAIVRSQATIEVINKELAERLQPIQESEAVNAEG